MKICNSRSGNLCNVTVREKLDSKNPLDVFKFYTHVDRFYCVDSILLHLHLFTNLKLNFSGIVEYLCLVFCILIYSDSLCQYPFTSFATCFVNAFFQRHPQEVSALLVPSIQALMLRWIHRVLRKTSFTWKNIYNYRLAKRKTIQQKRHQNSMS